METKDLKTEFDYTLKHGLQYSCKGDLISASRLIVRAPTNTVGHHFFTLDQAFNQAKDTQQKKAFDLLGEAAVERLQKNITENQEAVKDQVARVVTKENAASIVEIMLSGRIDIQSCMKALQSILVSKDSRGVPACLVDGTEPMTTMIWNDLSPNDAKGILGEYILNFITASQAS